MISRPRSAQAGFTLIELLSVIVIIVLLIAAVSPSLGNFTVKAKLASTKVNCRVVQSVITGYSTDHNGDIPTSRAQYYSSPTFQNLYNPFNNSASGIGSWGSTTGASPVDNAGQQAPVNIWNVDPASIALPGTGGDVFYTPYTTTAQAQSGANSLPIGGDGGSNGYSAYTIEAMAIPDATTPFAVPFADSRLQNF